MAMPLPFDAADPSVEILAALGETDGRPDAAVLRRAVSHAAAIAPTVIELVEKVAAGVYLTPPQVNVAFWGIHVLGVGRRAELYQPLLRVVRQADDDHLDYIFGDAVGEPFKQVVIAVFDGSPEPLFAAIEDGAVSSYSRWALFEALARLTFDGAISRERTFDFLDRFERERLAEPLDPAWEGWIAAVVYLGFERLHDRLGQAWQDGMFDETISSRSDWERQIAIAKAMRPGDAGLFDRDRISAITDVDEAFGWMLTAIDAAKRDAERRKGDPALDILRSHERSWLEGFLSSKHAPETAMTIDQLDGYFSAIAVCPAGIEADEYWPALWNYDAETEAAPDYDDDDQETYVTDLLARYLEAVKRRVAAGYPHPGRYFVADDSEEDRFWAAGFVRGVALRSEEWGERVQVDEDCGMFVSLVCSIGMGEAADDESRVTHREKTAFFKKLPILLGNLHRSWRGLATDRLGPMRPSIASETRYYDPATVRHRGRKIGRNEPCPCNSGKKFKRCCGAANADGG